MTLDMILGIFSVLQQVIPLLTQGAGTSSAIGNIITQLEKWLPVILREVSVLYEPTKNIIDALGNSPSTLPDQLKKLAEIDSQVDAAFEAAAKDVDPDA